jgi:hypothetical protein
MEINNRNLEVKESNGFKNPKHQLIRFGLQATLLLFAWQAGKKWPVDSSDIDCRSDIFHKKPIGPNSIFVGFHREQIQSVPVESCVQ